MTFEEHLEATRAPDGTLDLAAAEEARADELFNSQAARGDLAKKAAKSERTRWESRNRDQLKKLLSQPALSPELELDAKVPLGENHAVDYGDMDGSRIRIRRDLRLKSHIDENRAFDAEMSHWFGVERVLENGETIAEYLTRRDSAA